MKTIDDRIDRSVKLANTTGQARSVNDYVPMFPISTAEELKASLVKKLSAEYDEVATRLVFQSVNEAYALATLAGEPLLLLPALAEEKVRTAAEWSARQEVFRHTGSLAFAA